MLVTVGMPPLHGWRPTQTVLSRISTLARLLSPLYCRRFDREGDSQNRLLSTTYLMTRARDSRCQTSHTRKKRLPSTVTGSHITVIETLLKATRGSEITFRVR